MVGEGGVGGCGGVVFWGSRIAEEAEGEAVEEACGCLFLLVFMLLVFLYIFFLFHALRGLCVGVS